MMDNNGEIRPEKHMHNSKMQILSSIEATYIQYKYNKDGIADPIHMISMIMMEVKTYHHVRRI